MQKAKRGLIILFVFAMIFAGGCKSNEISFEKGGLPEGLPANSQTPYYAVKTVGNNVHLVVHWGEKSTGGYSVEVLSVTQERSGEVTVKTKLNSPAPDDFVLQAFTNPYVSVIVNKKDLKSEEAKFNFVDTEGKDISFANLNSASLEVSEIPFEKGWLPEGLPVNSRTPYYSVKTVGNNVYLVVHWGEKSTGGYSVEILSVTQDYSGEVTVKTKLNSPAPDAFVIQAFTNPYISVIINKRDLKNENAKFNFVDIEGKSIGFANYDNVLIL